MGLLSKFFPPVSDLSCLTGEEISRLRTFFDRGWASETRRLTGNSNDIFDEIIDQNIVRGLKKHALSKEELDRVIALLKADIDLRGDDEEEKEILRKLRRCRDEL